MVGALSAPGSLSAWPGRALQTVYIGDGAAWVWVDEAMAEKDVEGAEEEFEDQEEGFEDADEDFDEADPGEGVDDIPGGAVPAGFDPTRITQLTGLESRRAGITLR